MLSRAMERQSQSTNSDILGFCDRLSGANREVSEKKNKM